MKLKIFVFVQVFWLCTGFFGCLQDDIRLKNEKSGQRLIDYVDTRIGTGGLVSASGHTSPAISTPFGMVKPGPDTSTLGIITSSSGYHYGDMELVGFSQTRYFGTGSSEGGVLRLIPSNQSIENYESKNKIVHLFSHNHEVAEPGYYSVTTDNTGIFTEITSTDRVGVYNFNFSQTNDPVLILDVTSKLDGNKDFKDSRVVVDREKRTISGYTHLIGDFSSRYKGIRIYFYAQFDQAFADVVLSPQQKNLGNDISIKGQPLLVNLSFSETNQVGVKIGLSYTSEEKAKRNLKLEVGQRSFESVKIENQSRWETKLSKIQIEAEKNRKHIFYSALYRSYLMPNLYSDAPDPEDRTKASFIGFDSKMHSAHGFNYYSDLSLWDTFRTVHPLYVLIDQKSQSDMIQSLLSMAETGGTLPRWPSGAGYSSSMLGHPAAIMISESYLKGIRNFDARKALKFMVKSTSPKSTVVDRFGNDVDEYGKEFVDEYIKFGYCPSDTEESVSRTLEYSYADYSIYRLARELGESKIIDEYYQRSQNYKNLWNDQLKLFAPKKSDGHFIDSVSLTDTSYIRNTETGKAFVEGGANQWRWYLPQEPELLASMYGDQFIPQLNTFFENAKEEIGQMYPGVNYWHGNEPDLHASYLFNFGGRPDLTQKWVRWIIDHKYKASAQGLDGDDDAGTLSAWYVFSSLGFYPLAGTEKYVLGAPVVSNATVELDFIKGTKKLEIKVKNFSPSNIYVESVRMNGKLLNQPYITHAELALGGVLEFTMSAIPVNTFEGGAE